MSTFRLQQFSIEQTQSGMKICSDSLLFGAMIPIADAKRILDIGTGTGILSLMQGQKAADNKSASVEQITAIELTHAAAVEAQDNFYASPWHEYLFIIEQDIQSFSTQAESPRYDLIICNPPFFDQHTKTQSEQILRHTARHTDSLTYPDLCQSIERLITKNGRAFLLLPLMALSEFYSIAAQYHLYPIEQTNIAESKSHQPKVAMIELQNYQNKAAKKETTIYKFSSANQHSPEVREFLAPFLLRYENKEQYTRD